MELPRRPGPSVRVRVTEYDASGVRQREDRLATEEPLEVRLVWPAQPAQRVTVTMRTPGHDFELAAGLLLSEGALTPSLLAGVAYCTDADLLPEEEFNVVTVTLSGPPPRPPGQRSTGPGAGSSACGVCGAQSIDEVHALRHLLDTRETSRNPSASVSPAVLSALPARLRSAQKVFDRTGGLHAAGLFDSAGDLLLLREDIGRHNAVDKVVGARVLADVDTSAPLLMVSGRVGFEIVQKAAMAQVGALAAIGAPSSLAVDLARRSGLVLVGFLSAERFVVYSGADRVGV